jgi:hypothetical protein
MNDTVSDEEALDAWAWFETDSVQTVDVDDSELMRSFARCFRGADGTRVLSHLRHTILERRLGPKASDAELRFLEGQRSVVAHIISMLERSRS